MENAFGWLGSIIEWVGQLIPRIILIPPTHAGVKFVYGNKVKVLASGLHVYWPVVTEWHTFPIVRQTNNLSAQTLMTKDNKSVIVSAIIIFSVQNIEKALVKSWCVDETVNDIAQTEIVSTITSRSMAEIRDQIDSEIKDDLTQKVHKRLVQFGINVESCALTDFSTCFTVRQFTNKITPSSED